MSTPQEYHDRLTPATGADLQALRRRVEALERAVPAYHTSGYIQERIYGPDVSGIREQAGTASAGDARTCSDVVQDAGSGQARERLPEQSGEAANIPTIESASRAVPAPLLVDVKAAAREIRDGMREREDHWIITDLADIIPVIRKHARPIDREALARAIRAETEDDSGWYYIKDYDRRAWLEIADAALAEIARQMGTNKADSGTENVSPDKERRSQERRTLGSGPNETDGNDKGACAPSVEVSSSGPAPTTSEERIAALRDAWMDDGKRTALSDLANSFPDWARVHDAAERIFIPAGHILVEREELERLRKDAGWNDRDYRELCDTRDELLKERDALRAEVEQWKKAHADRCEQVDILHQQRDEVCVAIGNYCEPHAVVDRIRILKTEKGEIGRKYEVAYAEVKALKAKQPSVLKLPKGYGNAHFNCAIAEVRRLNPHMTPEVQP